MKYVIAALATLCALSVFWYVGNAFLLAIGLDEMFFVATIIMGMIVTMTVGYLLFLGVTIVLCIYSFCCDVYDGIVKT